MKALIPEEITERKIYLIRGQKIMLDKDLALLYGVPTKRLKEQVKRNIKRFPEDFMFELSMQELDILRSQFATSSWGGERYLPYAFTEQGVAMYKIDTGSQFCKLTKEENLTCQIGRSSYGGRRYLPYVFTQEGVAMLSSVVNSKRAIRVNIIIMRAFVLLYYIRQAGANLAPAQN
jgi:hypothetical protein